MEYHSIRQLEELCKTEQKPVWKIVLKAEQTETDETEKQIFERMRQMYHEMKAADEICCRASFGKRYGWRGWRKNAPV